MTFIFTTKDRKWTAIDPDTKAQMEIDIVDRGQMCRVRFSKPEMDAIDDLFLYRRRKFPQKFGDPSPPSNDAGIMIDAGRLNRLLGLWHQFAGYDFDRKTQFVEYVIRMMAFINKHHPLGTPPFLWSDYEDYTSSRKGDGNPFCFRMPSDEELMRFSIEA